LHHLAATGAATAVGAGGRRDTGHRRITAGAVGHGAAAALVVPARIVRQVLAVVDVDDAVVGVGRLPQQLVVVAGALLRRMPRTVEEAGRTIDQVLVRDLAAQVEIGRVADLVLAVLPLGVARRDVPRRRMELGAVGRRGSRQRLVRRWLGLGQAGVE